MDADREKVACLYLRVSTLKQAEKDLSIPDQERQLREYARTHGLTVSRVYVEPGASGRDDKRPAFQEMISDALSKDRPYDCILTLTTSRFFRDATKARVYKHNLAKRGVRVVAAHQETADDPMGRVVEGIFELIDQYESEMNAFHTARGMRENARQGYLNGRPRYGFKAAAVVDGRGITRHRPEVNPDEAAVVRTMFELAASGRGTLEVAKELNARGLTQRSGKPWSKQAVVDRLHDPAYKGTYTVSRFERGSRRLRPASDWITIAVEPIVTVELWTQVSVALAARAPELVNPAESGSKTLLSGLVRCGKCGSKMRLETAGGRSGPYLYYNCRSRLREGKASCPGTRVDARHLERTLIDHILQEAFRPERAGHMLQFLAGSLGNIAAERAEQRRALERELRQVNQRLRRQYEAIEAGIVNTSDVGDRIRELRGRAADIEARMASVPDPSDLPAIPCDEKAVEIFVANIDQVLRGDSRPAAQRLLRGLIERVEVDGEAARVYPRLSGLAEAVVADRWDEQPELTTPEVVHPTVRSRLRLQDSNLRPGG